MTLELRFWAKVVKGDGCWLWRGCTASNGYGKINVNGRPIGAHRVAYELLVGVIHTGLQIDHLCRVRNCVNPAHLEAVTRIENVRRGMGAYITRARHAAKTQCPRGHGYSAGNTYVGSHGRACRECQRMHQHNWRVRKGALVVAGS